MTGALAGVAFEPWLIAAGAGLAVTIALAAVGQMARSPQHIIRGRLVALRDESGYTAREGSNTYVEVMRGRRASRVPLVDVFLRSRRSADQMRRALEQAGLDLRIGEYLALRLLFIAAALVPSLLVTSLLGATDMTIVILGAGGLLGALLPSVLLRRRIAKRRAAIERELVEMCDLMSSMLQSGFGYLQAINSVADQVEQPLAGELGRMRDAIRLGAGVDESLEQLNERLESADFDMVATAITIQRRSGGSLAEILAGVAKTIRDRHLFRAEIKALTSRERYSAVVLAGFPVLLTAVLVLMVPETFGRLFTDGAGRVILGIALASDIAGYLAIKRVTRLEV
ncbi:MAG: type II secretion system F family protein [Dehalococcoidia bacterium]